jgi:hypothetical protein
MLDFDIGLDPFPNTEKGRMDRYEAYVMALIAAHADPEAPLPVMICRSDESEEQILDFLANALLEHARSQGLPVPWEPVPESALIAVAQALKYPFPPEVVKTAMELAHRMRTLHGEMKGEGNLTIFALERIEQTYAMSACVDAYDHSFGAVAHGSLEERRRSKANATKKAERSASPRFASMTGIQMVMGKDGACWTFPAHTLLLMKPKWQEDLGRAADATWATA